MSIVDNMRHTAESQLGGNRGAARRSSTPRVLHKVMATLDVSDAELGRRLNVSRQAIHARRTGRSSMTADDIHDVAEALNVDPAVFLGRPSEAVRWLVEHRADELDGGADPGPTPGGSRPRYGCTAPTLYRSLGNGEVVGAGIPVRWAA